MNLNPRKETIIVQDEFLLSTKGLIHKVGGVTLNGTSFGADGSIVKAGTAIMKDGGTGKFVPYADNAGAFPTGAEVYLLAQDQVVKGQNDMQAGAMVNAYVNTAKLTGVTTAFKTATSARYIFG
jgi:hypothetical protein